VEDVRYARNKIARPTPVRDIMSFDVRRLKLRLDDISQCAPRLLYDMSVVDRQGVVIAYVPRSSAGPGFNAEKAR
jgi:hypothetical protein